jgi:hypothetical protein
VPLFLVPRGADGTRWFLTALPKNKNIGYVSHLCYIELVMGTKKNVYVNIASVN